MIKLLLETESREIINEVKAIFKKQGNNLYDNPPQTIKDSIEKGIKDVEEGNVYTHEEVMKEVKEKFDPK